MPDWPSALDGLPDVDMTQRERSHMELSRRLVKKGLAAMRADTFGESTERFFEALEVDPGNVTARYNLACSLSRQGDRRAAVAVLDQLRDEGCGSCLGKVLKARRDPDFDAIRKTKAFQSVVADVEAPLPEPEDAAEAVRMWLAGSKKSATPISIDPRRKITVRVTCPNCGGSKPDVGFVRGPKALRQWLERKRRALPASVSATTSYGCKGKCCTFEQPESAAATPEALYPAELCFRTESGLVTSLSKVALTRYAIRTTTADPVLDPTVDGIR